MAKRNKRNKRKVNKIQATLLVLIAAGALMIALQWLGQSGRNQQALDSDEARAKGNPQAELQIVEFIDFQCPACAHGAKMLNNEYFQNYPDGMFIQVKHFPLQGHRHAFLAAQYAQCAARQRKFWPVHDLLIERQNQWKQLNDPRPDFDLIAREATVDMQQLERCLDSQDVKQTIHADMEEGRAKGVKSTPTYFVNGNMVVGSRGLKGALDYFFREQSP